ncbi:YraN family protein [bacterium BMS3Abin03]|jgi:putative endonuclease|nr:YraN family protein [bacterium BMS3Abin03]MCG6958577.1 YraN family protein [bacterium BMS3Abin03]
MRLSREELAKKGEQIAADFLEEKGFEIIERNYRYGHGELDIIAVDPSDGFTVFVEVKTRQNLYFGEPEYAITKSKQRQVKKVAELYLYDKEIENVNCRFDVIAILLEDDDNPVINHYENAFM